MAWRCVSTEGLPRLVRNGCRHGGLLQVILNNEFSFLEKEIAFELKREE